MTYRYQDYDRMPPRRRGWFGSDLVGHVVYGIFALSLFSGVPMLVGVLIAYLARGEVRGTAGEDHFTWAIRTFWGSLIFGVLFGLLTLVAIGWPLLGLLWLWSVYRIVRGWLAVYYGTRLYMR